MFQIFVMIAICLTGLLAQQTQAQSDDTFAWQHTHATVLPTGQIQWQPKPFVATHGKQVRYIDYRDGDDTRDGKTPNTAWQHHPWDTHATANAAADTTADTYLFKRGVTYRGKMTVKRQGSATQPITLTSDPTWGAPDAPAIWSGSQHITGFAKLDTLPIEKSDTPRDIKTALENWAKVTHPPMVKPNETFDLDVELPQTFPGEKLIVSLNWSKTNGQFGGYNNSAKPANIDATQGTHRFSITAKDKAELGSYSLAIYRSTTGSWNDRTAVGIIALPLFEAAKANTQPAASLIPDRAHVWYVDLDFAPRNLWMVDKQDRITRIPLARTPNWKVVDNEDIKSQWWQFDNPGNPHFKRITVGKTEYFLGIDTEHLTQDPSYYEGAYVWNEYGWVMGTPYPSRIKQFFPEKKGMAIEGQWGGGAGGNHLPRYSRYYLEDKPQYLDDPDGEFWFEKSGTGGRLYLRLPNDLNPNDVTLEAAEHATLLDATQINHLVVSGLTFRFTNTFWDLHAGPFASKDVDPACIRLLGEGDDIRITHNTFEYVNMPVRMVPTGENKTIDRVVITDNIMQFTDHGAVTLTDGSNWGEKHTSTRLLDVKLLRNKVQHIGMRPTRYGQGHAFDILCPQTCEVSGNVMDQLYGSGIFVFGGKRSDAMTDRPLTRILIHHNQVTNSLMNTNDWGGIETWQGGPAYVFNNVSGNPGGFKLWGIKNQPKVPATSRFGHAYYMDGGYKQYYFNNIAWGNNNDPYSPLGNTAAFQEIHGYLASVFNNTAWNFVIGSRRQGPEAGMNKYMGNIWDQMGYMVFRHADPSNQQADPNAHDVGQIGSKFDHATNVYVDNLFYKLPQQVGVFESSGNWYGDVPTMAKALNQRGSIGNLGVVTDTSPLRDAAQHDFRPTDSARDLGVRVFVPWALYATVGEWHFYHKGNDPTQIPDEHFHLASNYVKRTDYHNQPRFPLTVVGGTDADYVAGPLEDWTHGALQLDGTSRYAVLEQKQLDAMPDTTPTIRSPQVEESNFIIEVYFRAEGDKSSTIIVRKQNNLAGYSLTLEPNGCVRFDIKGNGQAAAITSQQNVTDKQWHHVLAECDRDSKTMRLYVDGKLDASGAGPGDVSLKNDANLYVGGSPDGQHLKGQMEFLRIAHGSLADARTTIDELHAWQFDGPFLRDFVGRKPAGKRDAGAISSQ